MKTQVESTEKGTTLLSECSKYHTSVGVWLHFSLLAKGKIIVRSKTIEKTFETSKDYVGIMSGAHLGFGDHNLYS